MVVRGNPKADDRSCPRGDSWGNGKFSVIEIKKKSMARIKYFLFLIIMVHSLHPMK